MRKTTETRAQTTYEWISSSVWRNRGYRPLKGLGIRDGLGHEREALDSRYYQLPSGHAATGAYLCKVHGVPSDRCWRCGRNVSQTRHHLLVKCEAWAPQSRAMWKAVGRRADGNTRGRSRSGLFSKKRRRRSGSDLPAGNQGEPDGGVVGRGAGPP